MQGFFNMQLFQVCVNW